MTRKQALLFIAQTGGKIFALRFLKRTTGEERTMNCRLDVTSHLKTAPDGPPMEKGVTIKPGGLITVFDMVKKKYRSVPVDGITHIKVNGEWLEVAPSEESTVHG